MNLYGVDPVQERRHTAFGRKIVRGTYPLPHQRGALISEKFAKRLEADIGSELTLFISGKSPPVTVTVTGIFRTGLDVFDQATLFCPFDLITDHSTSWSASVFLEQDIPVRRIITAYEKKWPKSYQFESWETLMPDLKQLIDLEYISMAIVIILVFVVVSVGISCAFVIFIIKNMREYGIMKSMGVTSAELALFLFFKVVLMNTIACSIGFAMGCVLVWTISTVGGIDISAFTSHNKYFAVSGIIYPRLTQFSLFAPPMASFVFCAIASIWPITLLTKTKTADIIRAI